MFCRRSHKPKRLLVCLRAAFRSERENDSGPVVLYICDVIASGRRRIDVLLNPVLQSLETG